MSLIQQAVCWKKNNMNEIHFHNPWFRKSWKYEDANVKKQTIAVEALAHNVNYKTI